MKKIVVATLLSLALTACGSGTDSATTDSKNIKYDDLFLTVSIGEGPLKGTHRFFKIEDSFMSFVSMDYRDSTVKNPEIRNTGKFNSNNLLSEDGNLTLMFLSKPFKGKITQGKHEGSWLTEKDGSKECGDFMIADTGKKYTFERMYSQNLSCNTVTLSGFSDWEEGTIYNRRAVTGSFSDRYELEFNSDEGKSREKVTTDVKVSFSARQEQLKHTPAPPH